MTKEQILTAITQAVNEGTIGNIDTGFISTIKTINNVPLKFFLGKQAQFNELSTEEKNGNLFAIITDDATKENLDKIIKGLTDDINNIINGKQTVGKAASDADGNNFSSSYAKLSSNYTEVGKKTVNVIDLTTNTVTETEFPLVSFNIGTILTYGGTGNKYEIIGSIINIEAENTLIGLYEGLQYARWYTTMASDPAIALVAGKWRVCGQVGTVTDEISNAEMKVYIVQRIE